jgi:protein-S-isoprenylcysteine O-methyltransferase Ste14
MAGRTPYRAPVHTLVARSLLAALLLWGSVAIWALATHRYVLRSRGAEETRQDRGTVVLIVLSIVVAVWAGYRVAERVPGARIASSGWALLVAGLVLFWAGALLGRWSARTLGRFYRPVVAVQQDHEVITGGPYRFVRHPLYAGALMTMAGIGLALGNWISLALCVVLPLAAYVRRIHVEERVLEERLGSAYRDYARGRARLIPGLW